LLNGYSYLRHVCERRKGNLGLGLNVTPKVEDPREEILGIGQSRAGIKAPGFGRQQGINETLARDDASSSTNALRDNWNLLAMSDNLDYARNQSRSRSWQPNLSLVPLEQRNARPIRNRESNQLLLLLSGAVNEDRR